MAAAMSGNGEDLNALISNLRCSNPLRVRTDIITVCSKYPALKHRSTVYIHNDGSECLLLMLEGTIPITFRSVVYHIPIEILIGAKYPENIPLCFVRPVKGMEVVKQHKFVEIDGKVSHPYLERWSSQTSNLVALTECLIVVFSQKPPVFSVQSRVSTPLSNSNISPINKNTLDRNSNRSSSSDPKQIILSKLESRLKQQIRNIYERGRSETEAEYRLNKQIEKGIKTVDRHISELTLSKERLIEALQETKQANEDIDTWLEEREKEKNQKNNSDNDDGSGGGGNDNDESIMIPKDAQSAKMFELVVESAALEDTMYALDKGLLHEVITLDDFMKQIRGLARQHFFAQAHIQKIMKVQKDSRL